jgi:hypothetical protein
LKKRTVILSGKKIEERQTPLLMIEQSGKKQSSEPWTRSFPGLSSLLVAITPLYSTVSGVHNPTTSPPTFTPEKRNSSPGKPTAAAVQDRDRLQLADLQLSHAHRFSFEVFRGSILHPAFNNAGTPPKLPICTDSAANGRVSLSPIAPAGEAERGMEGYEVCLLILFLLQLAILAYLILGFLPSFPFNCCSSSRIWGYVAKVRGSHASLWRYLL